MTETEYERVSREVGEQEGTLDYGEHGEDAWDKAGPIIVCDTPGGWRFGDSVVVEWDDGYKALGYLTCLPGHDQEDMQAVIHLPYVQGEKCSDAHWGSLLATALLPGIRRVTIGEAIAARPTEESDE